MKIQIENIQYSFNILRAVLDCPYKAWLLSKEEKITIEQGISFPEKKITMNDKITLNALYLIQDDKKKKHF